MSIVAQKRNSRRFKASISGRGTKGFSLNGGMRNQGWVGQTNLSRSHVGTVFRGAFPMGNGGCCGTYVINTQNSGRGHTNDSEIIKRSTMNTRGLIQATIEHPTSAILESNKMCIKNCKLDEEHNPVTSHQIESTVCKSRCKTKWVKDMSPFAFSSGEQIKWKKISAATKNLPWSVNKKSLGIKNCITDCGAASYWIGGKHYIHEPYAKDLNLYSVSPSMYQEAGLMRKNILPTPKCLAAFPFVLNHNSTCQVNFKTPRSAINAGALPLDWMSCEQTPNCCRPCENYGFRTFDLNMIMSPYGGSSKELWYNTKNAYVEIEGQNPGLTQIITPANGGLPPGEKGLVKDCDIMNILIIRGTNKQNLAEPQFTAALIEEEEVNPLPNTLYLTIEQVGCSPEVQGCPTQSISLGPGYRWPSPRHAVPNGWPPGVPYKYRMANGKLASIFYWNTSGQNISTGGGVSYPPPMIQSDQDRLNALLSKDTGKTYRLRLRFR